MPDHAQFADMIPTLIAVFVIGGGVGFLLCYMWMHRRIEVYYRLVLHWRHRYDSCLRANGPKGK